MSDTFDIPPIGEAAFFHLLEDYLEIVYWNQNQKEFDRLEDHDFAGCIWRPYDWGWDADLDWDKENSPQPLNFQCLELIIWWYKYPLRGAYCNVNWDGNQWADWLERAIKLVESHDVCG